MSPETSTLKIAIEEPKTWARHLTITVPAARVDRERESVARRLSQRLRLPGFRKGKVPPNVVNRQFGEAIRTETVERVVDEAYREALQEKGLQPISEGHVDEVTYEPGEDLTFHVHFEIEPSIELSRLGGFKVTRPDAAVSDEDVARVIQRLRSEHATWNAREGSAPVVGDRVVVDITAVKETEGSPPKPRRYQIVLGEGQAIEDVEKAIQTLSPGESGEFVINVPGAEEGEAPEEQTVRVDLIGAEQPELPELDDAFAGSVGEFESLEALRNTVREDLEREAQTESERVVRRALIDQIVEANPFEVPDSMVTRYVQSLLPAREGAPEEQLRQMWDSARPGAERALQRSFVVEKVAELQELKPSTEEVDARVEDLATRSGRPVGEVWAQLQRSGRIEGLEKEILEDKVFAYLEAQSTVEAAGHEPEPKPEPKGKKRKSKKG